MLTNNWWLMRARNVFLVFHYCKAVAEKRGMNVCIGTQTASGETAKLYNKNTLSETWSINTAECDNTAEKVLKTEAWTMRNNEFANSGSKSKLIFGDEMTDVPIKCFTIHEQQQQQKKDIKFMVTMLEMNYKSEKKKSTIQPAAVRGEACCCCCCCKGDRKSI